MASTTYSLSQVQAFATSAGFKGNALVSIMAIAWCESTWRSAPIDNVNADGSRDRGILQINNKYHSEVSDACAYNPTCAFQAAYRISNGGTNFTPWATYKSLAYNTWVSNNASSVLFPGGITPATGSTGLPTTSTSSNTGSGDSGYRYIVAYGVAIVLFMLSIRSRLGYNTMYYLLTLALLMVVLVEYKFITEAVAPLTGTIHQPPGDVAPSRVS